MMMNLHPFSYRQKCLVVSSLPESFGPRMETSENVEVCSSIHQNLPNMGPLSFVRLLSESPDRKLAVIEAKVKGSSDPAVVVLEKLPFSEETANSLLAASTEADQEFTNDIYGQYQLQPLPAIN